MATLGIDFDFNGGARDPGPTPEDLYVKRFQGIPYSDYILGIGSDGYVLPVQGTGGEFTWKYRLSDLVLQDGNEHWYRIVRIPASYALGIRMQTYPGPTMQNGDILDTADYFIFHQTEAGNDVGKWNYTCIHEIDRCPLAGLVDQGMLEIYYKAAGPFVRRILWSSCELLEGPDAPIWFDPPQDSGSTTLPPSAIMMTPTVVQTDQGTANSGKVLSVSSAGIVTPIDLSSGNDGYVKKDQGTGNSGKVLGIGTDGIVTPVTNDVSGKVDKMQGQINSGKVLGIGSDGLVLPVPAGGGGGGIFPWEAVTTLDIPAVTLFEEQILTIDANSNVILRWVSESPYGATTARNGITDYYISWDGIAVSYSVVGGTARHFNNYAPFWYMTGYVGNTPTAHIYWKTEPMGYHAHHNIYCQVINGSYTTNIVTGSPPIGATNIVGAGTIMKVGTVTIDPDWPAGTFGSNGAHVVQHGNIVIFDAHFGGTYNRADTDIPLLVFNGVPYARTRLYIPGVVNATDRSYRVFTIFPDGKLYMRVTQTGISETLFVHGVYSII